MKAGSVFIWEECWVTSLYDILYNIVVTNANNNTPMTIAQGSAR